MKRPAVYLSKAFLQKIDECEPTFRAKRGNPETGEFIPAELKTLERIVVLLLHGELFTDFDDKEAVKLYKKASAAKNYETFSDLIVQRAIKQERFHHSVGAFTRYLHEDGTVDPEEMTKSTMHRNATYFLPVNHESCDVAAAKSGLAVLGINFDFRDFFTACTLSNYATTHELETIEKIAHLGNALVIIDKFILTYASNKPDKIPSIIATVKKFMPSQLGVKFELTIVTEHIENDALANKKALAILEGLGGSEKVSFKLIAARAKTLKESDRYILSNYLSVSVGHPFDRNTILSSSSIISQDSRERLEEAFKTWHAKLQLAKFVVANTSAIPNSAFVFESEEGMTHRLLNLY